MAHIELTNFVNDICELDDGTIVVAGSFDLKRWDLTKRTVLQSFRGHTEPTVKVLKLKSDTIVSTAQDSTVKIWKVSTCECVSTLVLHDVGVATDVLVKLKDGYFATGSRDRMIRVWNDAGIKIATYQTECNLTAMAKLESGSIVAADSTVVGVWKP